MISKPIHQLMYFCIRALKDSIALNGLFAPSFFASAFMDWFGGGWFQSSQKSDDRRRCGTALKATIKTSKPA